MKCPSCGGESNSRFCGYCGCEMPYRGPEQVVNDNSTSKTIINNYYINDSGKQNNKMLGQHNVNNPLQKGYEKTISIKSKGVALFLCFFLGMFGAHHFYVGKNGMGIAYLFTGGMFSFGWMYDIYRIIANKFTDVYGNYLVD